MTDFTRGFVKKAEEINISREWSKSMRLAYYDLLITLMMYDKTRASLYSLKKKKKKKKKKNATPVIDGFLFCL